MQQPPAEKVEHVWETVTISSESSSTTPACTSITLTSIFLPWLSPLLGVFMLVCNNQCFINSCFNYPCFINPYFIFCCFLYLFFFFCCCPCFIICRNFFLFLDKLSQGQSFFFFPVFCRFKTFLLL